MTAPSRQGISREEVTAAHSSDGPESSGGSGSLLVTPDTQLIQSADAAGAALIGLPLSSIVGRKIADVLGQDAATAAGLAAHRGGAEAVVQLSPAGKTRSVRLFVNALRGPDGTMTQLLVTFGSLRPTTLEDQHERLQNIIEGTRAGTWEWNVQTGATTFNETWAEMLGYTLEELGPTTFATWERFAHPEDTRRTEELLKKHFSGELPYYENTCRMRHKDGRWIWVLDRGRLVSRTPDGKPERMLGSHTEITAQKNTELAARETGEQLRLAIEAGRMGVFDWDLRSNQLALTSRNREIWGYEPSQFTGTHEDFFKRIHPEDRPTIAPLIERCRVTGEPFNHEFRVVWPDASVHWVSISGQVGLDEAGQPARLHGVSMNITERRRAAEEIERQNGLIRALLDSVPDLMFFKDHGGVYLGCNPAFAAFAGRAREEIIGRTDFDLFPPEQAERFRLDDRMMMELLNQRKVEEWCTYPDGRRVLLETVKTPYRGPDGQVLGVLGISRDITVRNRETLLQQARARLLEFATEHTVEELLVATLDEAEVLTGSQIGFFHFLEPDQQTLALQAWSTRTTREMCRAEGKGQHYHVNAAGVWVDCIRERRPVIHNDYLALQHRHGLPKGHAKVQREMVVPVVRHGLIVCIVGLGNKAIDYTDDDVTVVSRLADFIWDTIERKRAEVALSDHAARLRLALVAANQGLFDVNLVTGATTVSPEYAKILGYDPANFTETTESWSERLHPDDRARAIQMLDDYRSGRLTDYRSEFRLRMANGTWKWILSVGRIVERTPAGEPVRMLGSHTDISEAKQAEAALRISEERHRHLVETSADWIWEIDPNGRYTYASSRIKDLLGYEVAEVIGKSPLDFMAPDEVARIGDSIRETISARRPFINFENKNLHRDGHIVILETSGVPVFDATGTFVGYRGIDRDITARRLAERQLRLHGAALQAAANAVVITDSDGRIEWTNPAFTALSGWQLSEALGRRPGDLIGSKRHGPEFFSQMWQTVTSGGVWQGEVINRRKDGSLRTEDMTITPLTDERGKITHFIAIKQDITDRKMLEAQNRQSQRMEALGTMAGGIAHDLNNILAPIVTVAELLREDVSDEKSRGLLEMMHKSALRGAGIIQQLLTFSRGIEGERVPVQALHVLKEVIHLLRETFPREINLVLDAPAPLPLISADPTQVHQVLLNLCVNARDAMPAGGHLTLSAHAENLAPGDARLPSGTKPGPFVLLQVRDTGQGIPPEILHRIFDPFFTTKPVGKGTGLGLSTVQGIVRSHGGFVTVESTPNTGTIFRAWWPATGETSAPAAPAVAKPEKGTGELILVVDDERYIRDATALLFQAHGYRVIVAVNGHDALAQFQQHRDELALILTDLMMPLMNGVALARAVREQRSDVPIVVTTGLSDAQSHRDLATLGVAEVLMKPCDGPRLLNSVKRHLRRKA